MCRKSDILRFEDANNRSFWSDVIEGDLLYFISHGFLVDKRIKFFDLELNGDEVVFINLGGFEISFSNLVLFVLKDGLIFNRR